SLQPRLRCRAVRIDRADQGACWIFQTEGVRKGLAHVLYSHAKATSSHMTHVNQLVFDSGGNVDRNGEGQPLKSAIPAIDLRVDADYLALQVEQGPTGVARVDRNISLQKGDVAAAQRSGLRADDPCRDRVVEAVGGTDSDYPLADLELRRVTELDGRQM